MTDYKCSIIANPEGKAWELAEEIYHSLEGKRRDTYDLNEARFTRFPDGEQKVKIKNNIRRSRCVFIHDSNETPDTWFMQLCQVNQALKSSSASEIFDVLPYLKFARQDRKDESRVPITARLVANSIGLYADRVLTLDVHNPAIQGFYCIPFDSLHSFPRAVEAVKDYFGGNLEDVVVMSTDAGGEKRAEGFAKRLGTDRVSAHKTREGGDGDVEDMRIKGDVRGKTIIAVDDILASGGTIKEAAIAARKEGAREVIAYCTHGLFTKGAGEDVLGGLDCLLIGDTVHPPENHAEGKIKVISFAGLFSEAIHRVNEGMSLSDLFKHDDEEARF